MSEYIDKNNCLKLSIEVRKIDYSNLIAAVKKLLSAGEGMTNVIMDILKKIPVKVKDQIFIRLIRTPYVNKQICSSIEVVLKKRGITVKVKGIDAEKRKEGILLLQIEITAYNFSEIFLLLTKILSDNQNKHVRSIAAPALNVLNTSLPDEIKKRLVFDIINECSEGICELIMERLAKKLNLYIVLDELKCQMG